MRHIVEEAHVEHSVGLVEDDGLHAVEPERFALIMIHQPPRRRHDDLRVFFQLLDLALDLRAAIDHGHADLFGECQKAAQLVADLDGQLARRRKDQALKVFAVRVDVLDHRDAEGKRLARAGRGLGDDVLPFHERRDGLGLNFGRVAVALLLQRL